MSESLYRNQPESKAWMLETIQNTHDQLEGALALLDAEQMLQPVLDGGWSAKDTMAHITEWEQIMLRWFAANKRGEASSAVPEASYGWGEGTDDEINELNARLYAGNKERPLQDVRVAFNRSYEEVLSTFAELDEEDLLQPGRSDWVGGRPLWKLVAANTYWHYPEHSEALEKHFGS